MYNPTITMVNKSYYYSKEGGVAYPAEWCIIEIQQEARPAHRLPSR